MSKQPDKKEYLEAIAKAANYDLDGYVWEPEISGGSFWLYAGDATDYFDPSSNDEKAFQVMVELGISIDDYEYVEETGKWSVFASPYDTWTTQWEVQGVGENKLAATREAICKVAYELGVKL